MPTDTDKVFQHFNKLRQQYPNAIPVFSPSDIGFIFNEFSQRGVSNDFTPAYAVIRGMITFKPELDFPDRENLQGFVNVVGLFAGVCQAKALRTPLFYDSVANFFQHWDNLPIETSVKFQGFLRGYGDWALANIGDKDLRNGKNFMRKLVDRIERDGASGAYLSGAKIARETFFLYVELIEEWLRGKFRR